jgi:predicted CxxxxCH...CXXCH cytochrome family protein
MKTDLLVVLMSVVVLAGCQENQLADGLPAEGDITCTTCHGESEDPAPPTDVSGNSDSNEIGVGAHRKHLRDGVSRRAIECQECHLVPETVDQDSHVDPLPAEMTWGPLASSGGLEPLWDHEGARCSNTYCHGASLSGGATSEPIWTRVDGTQAECDSCHGNPPPTPHTSWTECNACHPDTVLSNGQIDLAGGHHIDGVKDAPVDLCTACHGSDDDPTPPLSVNGSSDTADPGVGAHREHLGISDWHLEIQCDECHVVPADAGDTGHLDTALPAELIWGPLALADGAEASYDRSSNTCSNYCHGSTLEPGGTLTRPEWTRVDGTQSECGTCHGLPPGGGHVVRQDCETCHGMVVDADQNVIEPNLHVDGVVDVVELACDTCHGSDEDPAPPLDTQGNQATSLSGVGAHREHLGLSGWHKEIQCDECHLVPQEVDDPGHRDTVLPAELTWGGLATADNTTPVYDSSDNSCGSVYCHGATLEPGGSVTRPVWTQVDGSQAQCGSCHSLPPGGNHVLWSDCQLCHGMTVDAGQNIIAPDRHIDGSVDVSIPACDACHGSDGNPAPPLDTQGNSSTTARGVGAHREHLGPSNWHQEIQCSECHLIPTLLADPGHLDSLLPAELSWGPLATDDGAQPIFDETTTSCSQVYCHGETLHGTGSNRQPDWTRVNQGEVVCGSCHELPPGPPHSQQTDCTTCHECVVDDNQNIRPENAHLHINGRKNFEQLGSCPPP